MPVTVRARTGPSRWRPGTLYSDALPDLICWSWSRWGVAIQDDSKCVGPGSRGTCCVGHETCPRRWKAPSTATELGNCDLGCSAGRLGISRPFAALSRAPPHNSAFRVCRTGCHCALPHPANGSARRLGRRGWSAPAAAVGANA